MFEEEDLSDELVSAAQCAAYETLPLKSKERYMQVYNDFEVWKKSKNAKSISETVLMAFFYEMSQKMKPTSLWAYYSMLKSTIKLKNNVDIGTYHQISAFLKTKSSGYKSIKAKVFAESEIQKFISEAPDKEWLDIKVVCTFGVSGALRGDELAKVKVGDIEQHNDMLLVRVLQTKTKVSRSFTIHGEFYKIVQKYSRLRAPKTTDNRFFVNYQHGKCTVQVIGSRKFAQMPRRIASYLHLDEPERYTGHSFRRTSATILANTGASMETIKRHGNWRSSTVAEGYIEDSLEYKKRTGAIITEAINATKASVSTRSTFNNCSQGYVEFEDDPHDDVLVIGLHSAGPTSHASQGYVEFASDVSDDLLVSSIRDAGVGSLKPLNESVCANDSVSHSKCSIGNHNPTLKTFTFTNCTVTMINK